MEVRGSILELAPPAAPRPSAIPDANSEIKLHVKVAHGPLPPSAHWKEAAAAFGLLGHRICETVRQTDSQKEKITGRQAQMGWNGICRQWEVDRSGPHNNFQTTDTSS